MKAKKYDLQKRKINTPIVALVLARKSGECKSNYLPVIKTRKKRFGIYTKNSEE